MNFPPIKIPIADSKHQNSSTVLASGRVILVEQGFWWEEAQTFRARVTLTTGIKLDTLWRLEDRDAPWLAFMLKDSEPRLVDELIERLDAMLNLASSYPDLRKDNPRNLEATRALVERARRESR